MLGTIEVERRSKEVSGPKKKILVLQDLGKIIDNRFKISRNELSTHRQLTADQLLRLRHEM